MLWQLEKTEDKTRLKPELHALATGKDGRQNQAKA
jgi:hypothetical protein